MRVTATKTVSAVAIAGVAVLGAQYAGAATNDVHAQVTPLRNIAHVYSATTTGGTGEVVFSIPDPGDGVYQASFSANFVPQGTPSAPETFSCAIVKNSTIMRTQDTVTSTSTGGFYAGVNGSNAIREQSGSSFQLYCGTADGTTWSWGTLPAQVTLTRLDGLATGTLTETARKAGSLSPVTAAR